jgi:hypothetical protein
MSSEETQQNMKTVNCTTPDEILYFMKAEDVGRTHRLTSGFTT